MKRGLTQQEAMAYVGVKRRTWEANWAPRLTGIHQGVCLIYDRQDLDKLFDAIKAEAAGEQPPKEQDAANDSAHNAARNGRPIQEKGRNTWAKARGASTPTKTTTPGKLTSGGAVSDFASAASLVLKKRTAG